MTNTDHIGECAMCTCVRAAFHGLTCVFCKCPGPFVALPREPVFAEHVTVDEVCS